jgi:hypothetical protein
MSQRDCCRTLRIGHHSDVDGSRQAVGCLVALRCLAIRVQDQLLAMSVALLLKADAEYLETVPYLRIGYNPGIDRPAGAVPHLDCAPDLHLGPRKIALLKVTVA